MEYIFSLIPSMVEGLGVTLEVFAITLVLSIPLGVIVALARLSEIKILRGISSSYIYIMRGTPLLLQLVVIFFGFPILNISLERFTAAIIAFVFNYTAYFAEIFRGGIKDIDEGQYEAAEVLGFSKIYTLRKILIPQMIKKVLPSVTNEVITLVKDTSLIYVVGISELLRVGKIASNRDTSLIPLFLVGAIYLAIIAILSKLLSGIETKYTYYKS